LAQIFSVPVETIKMSKSALGRSLKAAPNFEKGLFRKITLHLLVKNNFYEDGRFVRVA
jgi:hypothetical protein